AEDINEPGLQKTTLEALFREADIVSLHLSSGPHSDGLVNAALLNSMKPGALLINTSRAAVVDEAALIDALRHGPLGGAAFNNEFGRPALNGYFRTYEEKVTSHNGEELRGYHKPIMLAGGIGNIRGEHVQKGEITVGAKLIVLGGPAMNIGLGGGAASSMASGQSDADLDFASV
ncbi:hypothetical protein LUD45_32400, partial [Klebsiella pneumoniae]|nr:hypothetical protein [Klebsiella pneumoniae]